VIDVPDWATRYGARVDSWRLPTSQTKRTQLAQTYGDDALALLRAVYGPQAPDWLSQLPAVEILRRVLVGELPHPHRRPRAGGDHTAGGRHRRSPTGVVALTDGVLGQAELMRRRRRRVPPPQSGFAGFRFRVSRTLKGA
jgi:hypothetical protein